MSASPQLAPSPKNALFDALSELFGVVTPPQSFNFVGDVLQRWARETPEAIATIGVAADGSIRRWSFREVDVAVGRLASAMTHAGITKGDRVLIFMPRTPLWQVAMSACLHIGAIPVPCVTQITPDELAYRATQCGAAGGITSEEFVPRFAAFANGLKFRAARGQASDWLDLEQVIAVSANIPPVAHMPAETPALMYFTSGSSGLPKAVVHAARGVYVRGRQPWQQLALQPGNVIWTTSDTGWTRAGSCLLFGAWSHGATSLLVEKNLSVQERIDMLIEHKVTIFGAVATELRQILAARQRPELGSLRWTLSAGEAMTAELANAWKEFSGTPLLVGYGQTETPTATITEPDATPLNGMIGKPMLGNPVTVLNGMGQEAETGEAGEIAFGGWHPGLMLGYWRDGGVFYPFESQGWHMTGDCGYRDANGNLFFVGRTDDIISSSGYRIGPTEVENALARHPAVAECAVVASPDSTRGEIVKAFVILRSGYSGTAELTKELQDFTKGEVAPYKYPRAIEFVNDLPRTTSGKISRRELRLAEFTKKGE